MIRTARLLLVAFVVLVTALLGASGAAPALANPTPATQPAEPAPGTTAKVPFGSTFIAKINNRYRARYRIEAGRNVATFRYKKDGKVYYVTAASVSTRGDGPWVAVFNVRDAQRNLVQLPDQDGNLHDELRVENKEIQVQAPSRRKTRQTVKGKHSEEIIDMILQEWGTHPDQVQEIFTELEPCNFNPNNCERLIRTKYKGAAVSYNFDYHDDATRDQGPKDLKSAVEGFYEALDKLQTMFRNTTNSAAAGELVNLLSGLGAPPPGGIDFSTLQLRYLSDAGPGDTRGLRYSFSAASGGNSDLTAGRTAALQSSDAFFVWLSLPESKFWVNLNPSEPDRIIDDKLGTTDVGRILLQADFQMKKLVGQLIQPDTNLGMQFWGSPYNSSHRCINMRQWIVPAPATVYEQNGGLYIVDTPLQVKMETDYLKQQGEASSCITPDTRMESTFRTLVLPKVEDAVNHAPEFAELRQVYLSRVAVEWYRQRHSHGDALSSMIDSDNVSAWPARQQWSPHQVFHQYVDSYQKNEFNVTSRVTQGDTIYENTYTYGGVDFSNVVLNQAPQSLFQRDHADLPSVVQQSTKQLATDQHGKVWLGSTAPSTISSSPQGSGGHFTMYLLLLVVIGVAGAVWARSWWRLRLAPHVNPPVRPQATQGPAKPQPTQTRSFDRSNLGLRSPAVQAEYRRYRERKLARESRKPPTPNQHQHRRDDQ